MSALKRRYYRLGTTTMYVGLRQDAHVELDALLNEQPMNIPEKRADVLGASR